MKADETISFFFSLLAVIISCGGLFYVIQQVRLLKRQLQVDFKSRAAAVNRELLGLAFNNPELFLLFEDKPLQSKSKQRHYIQMWLNHISLMWDARQQKLLSDAEWYSDTKDIADFFSIEIVRTHWEEVKSFYPPDFVGFISTLKRGRPEST